MDCELIPMTSVSCRLNGHGLEQFEGPLQLLTGSGERVSHASIGKPSEKAETCARKRIKMLRMR